MAITKIIAIRDRLDKRVNYAVNGEKTTLDAGITYAANPEKTEQHFFTSAINCESCETAFAEMQATKRRFGKLGGVVGYHFIQSFAPGEVTPEQAHAIGVAFAQRLFGERYEVVVGTHLDKAHLHNHVVVNSVSFVDGKKYHSSPGSYYFEVRSTSDTLCRENDLSTITPQGKGKHYAEWKAENTGKLTIRSIIRGDIDSIIGEAYTYVRDGRQYRGYKVGRVFDISQTAGRGQMVKNQLTDNSDAMSKALYQLLTVSPVPIVTGDARGQDALYDPNQQQIIVSGYISDSAAFRALSREIVHAGIHDHGNFPYYSRESCALGADSVSYMLCRSYGVPCDRPRSHR